MDTSPSSEIQLQPWHQPTVIRLEVAADTRLGQGSTIDQDGFDFLAEDGLGSL